LGSTIWSGLTLGAIYVMIALGFTLSLLPSGVFNFAQGAIVGMGTYLTYQWLRHGLPWEAAALLNLVIGIGLGLACELIAIRPLRFGRATGRQQTELVTTVGLSTMLGGVATLIWGVNALRVPFPGPQQVVRVAGIVATPVSIILVAAAIVAGLALHLVFQHSRWGQACLAVAEDRSAASLRGINVNLLSLAAFAGAGALGTLSAILIGPITYATPDVTLTLALGGFVALALGGNGSFLGAIPGGLVVGLCSSFATRYLGGSYADIAVLALLLVVLMTRPSGFGGRAAGRVV
jgi:branched-chain amino acid transport system permease protein